MNVAFGCLACLILASAGLALSRRNLIHSVLLLVGAWFGVAGFYLWAGAEFVAFGQVLVYGGAVSMVVLFAVLLTRREPLTAPVAPASRRRAASAVAVGAAVFAVLAAAVLRTPLPRSGAASVPPGVRELGQGLMGPQAGALLAIGALLTVALLGAVALAAAGGGGKDAS